MVVLDVYEAGLNFSVPSLMFLSPWPGEMSLCALECVLKTAQLHWECECMRLKSKKDR